MTVNNLPRLNVEFKTLDGLTLSALLFPATNRGPGMVMSPGVRVYLCFEAPVDWNLCSLTCPKTPVCPILQFGFKSITSLALYMILAASVQVTGSQEMM